jgi:sialic acid synthase SpsE
VLLGNRRVGLGSPPLVIAEIGINHEGSLEKASRMVVDAFESGAECVKFQRHVIDDEMIPSARNVIPGNSDDSIYDIMERCALTKEEDLYLKNLTEGMGMIYMSTPFSRAAADELEDMGVCAYKIGSGECNNYPLVEHIAKFKKPIVLSTGMNDIESIKPCVDIFHKYEVDYALLHCTSMYPTPYEKVRLGALKELKDAFPQAVLGLSDHSLGNYTCFGSIPLGASILEKHFTSSKSWPGPDIPISITPIELQDLIQGSNAIYSALGGTKSILEEEQPTIDFAYASVVTTKDIPKGGEITSNNIWVKRPGTGKILAKDYKSILGKHATKDLSKNLQLSYNDFN